MMNKGTLFFSFLFTLLSCVDVSDKKPTVKGFHSNGNLEYEFEVIDSIPHGIGKVYFSSGKLKSVRKYDKGLLIDSCFFYFENGNIESVQFFENDKLNGYCKYYYENGKISQEGEYNNDFKIKKHFQYYNNEMSNINFEIDYIILNNKSYPNTFIEFSEKGEILTKSPWLSIKSVGDSVSIELKNKEFDSVRVIYGSFNEFFVNKTKNSLDTISSSSTINYFSKISLENKSIIRGFVENYQWKNHDPDTRKTISRDVFFEFSPSNLEPHGARVKRKTSSSL